MLARFSSEFSGLEIRFARFLLPAQNRPDHTAVNKRCSYGRISSFYVNFKLLPFFVIGGLDVHFREYCTML